MKFENGQFHSNEPIYLQIVELIKKAIATGELKADEKLPSVREMSQLLSVNPNTMQRAYGELERQGMTETRRGLGSFVSSQNHDVDTLKTELAKTAMEKCLVELKTIGLSDEEIKALMEELL